MTADPFPFIAATDEEVWRDASYQWDNACRPRTDYCVVQRTLAGAVAFTIDGQCHEVGAGRAFLFTHHEASSYGYPPGAKTPYRLQFVAFSPRSLRPFFDALREEFGSVVNMRDDGEAARLLDEILKKNRRGEFLDQHHLTELLCRLLLCLHREQVAAKQTEDPIKYGYYLINDNAGGRLTIKEIARLAGVSREYFNREYARRYHATPGATLRALRLERARAMLLATALPLADIAAACGFGSDDALRRSFEQHFGKKPLSLRRASNASAVVR